MSLKYYENEDFSLLFSDLQQSLDVAQSNFNLEITAFKDILIWAESLEQAKKIAKYALTELECKGNSQEE